MRWGVAWRGVAWWCLVAQVQGYMRTAQRVAAVRCDVVRWKVVWRGVTCGGVAERSAALAGKVWHGSKVWRGVTLCGVGWKGAARQQGVARCDDVVRRVERRGNKAWRGVALVGKAWHGSGAWRGHARVAQQALLCVAHAPRRCSTNP
uniref:Secreted protein n=1 Tax=Chlamydomonas euryale TaxID=1486919 RepID=A0A7R9VJZ1_9CHLO|mmetsp:Transcript_37605/g.111215  ORF Transcript_37605/g.111215 Transcript_37605/m.111215 type:complete len:148 (+) Transcript_37605:111-554(+)